MGLTQQDKSLVRTIVREETADLRQDVKGLRTGVTGVNEKLGGIKHDIMRLGVLYENFDHKMDAIAELVTTTVKTKNDVDRHDREIKDLQLDMAVVKAVIKKKA